MSRKDLPTIRPFDLLQFLHGHARLLVLFLHSLSSQVCLNFYYAVIFGAFLVFRLRMVFTQPCFSSVPEFLLGCHLWGILAVLMNMSNCMSLAVSYMQAL